MIINWYADQFLEPYFPVAGKSKLFSIAQRSELVEVINDDVIAVPLYIVSRVGEGGVGGEEPFKFDVEAGSVGKIYLSTSGIQLLSLSLNLRKGSPKEIAVFVETYNDRDAISSAFFDIVLPFPLEASSGNNFLQNFKPIETVFRDALRLNDVREYQELVLSRLNPNSSALQQAANVLLPPMQLFLTGAISLLEVVNPIIEKLTMPENVWKRSARSKDWKNIFNGIVKSLDKLLANIPDFKGTISQFRSTVQVDFDFITGFLDKLNQIFSYIEKLITSIRDFIDDISQDLQDSTDAFISFVSGLWDGLIDLVSGLLNLVLLLMQFGKAQLDTTKDLDITLSMFTEVIDEALQAIASVEWLKVWRHITQKKIPELVDFVQEEFDALVEKSDDPSILGYYLGYFIFNIIENFFPPLKLSKLAAVAKTIPTPVTKALKRA